MSFIKSLMQAFANNKMKSSVRVSYLIIIFFTLSTSSLFAIETSLTSGELRLRLNGVNESVTVSNNGSQITIESNQSITGLAVFNTSEVTSITIDDLVNGSGQSLVFEAGTDIVLAGGLSSTGVETLTIWNSITVTGTQGINLTAPQTIIIREGSLNGGNGGVQLTGLGTVAADTYGVVLRTGSLVTATGMGEVNIYGKGGANNINTTGVLITTNSIVTSSGGDVSVTGVGGVTGGVTVTFSGQITAGGMGQVTVDGTGASLLSNGSDAGVRVWNDGIITSSGGNVIVNGRGSTVDSEPNKIGVDVARGGLISAGGSGSVMVTGNGGISSGNFNWGVLIADGAITSSAGNVQVIGFGGGKEGSIENVGVRLVNGGVINAGANGTVTVEGTGGNTTASNNHGIHFDAAAIQETSRIRSSGGAVNIKGIGGNNSKDIFIGSWGEITGVGGADIVLEANSLDFAGSPMGAIVAPASDVSIIPRTEDVKIRLGGNDILSPPGSAALGLTNTELGQISAGSLILGSNDLMIGDISITAAISLNHIPNVELITPRSISVGANVSAAAVNTVFNANQQDIPTNENFTGVTIQNNIEVNASGLGNVFILARGGETTGGLNNHGIHLNGGAVSTENGSIVLEGFKGAGADVFGLLQTGTAQILSNAGNVIINKTEGWSPDNPNTDVIVASNSLLLLSSDSRTNLTIDGLIPNMDYQQLKVEGRINLNGADLSFDGSTYSTTGNESFTIIDNDGVDQILGIFNGLPEGGVISNFLDSGLDAFVTYSGGDGNDVVITVKEPLEYCYESTRGENVIRLNFTETGTFNERPRLVAPFFFNFNIYYEPDFENGSGAWMITYLDEDADQVLVAYILSDAMEPPVGESWVTLGEIGFVGLIIGGTEAVTGVLSDGICDPISDCDITVSTECGNTLSGSYTQSGFFEGRPLFTDSNNNGIFYFNFGGNEGWFLTSLGGVVSYTNASTSSNPPVLGWESGGLCTGTSVEVMVNDFELPVIDCSNISTQYQADLGDCGFTVEGDILDPLFGDQCSNVSISNDFNSQNTLSGEVFPVGSTIVTWVATDDANNSASCMIEIEVSDTQTLGIDCGDISTALSADPGNCSYEVMDDSLGPIFSDNCVGANLINDLNNESSLIGEVFPLGITNITWTVSDQSGNSNSCEVSITVTDDENPVLDCSNINTELITDPGQCDYTVTDQSLNPNFSDNCPDVMIVNEYNNSNTLMGETLSIGISEILWIAIDNAGNRDSCLVILEIIDNELPDLDCSNIIPMRDNDDGECGYLVVGSEFDPASFSDNCPNPILVNSYTNSETLDGAILPIGFTPVIWTVTDASGNSRTCEISYEIIDDEPPVIICKDGEVIFNGEPSISPNADELVEAEGNCGIAGVTLSTPDIFCDQIGQVVPLAVTVTDPNNNTSICTSNVTVTGLTCGWRQNPDGVGCTEGNSTSYDPVKNIWTVTSTNCFYGAPFNSDATAFAQRTLCGNGSITAQVTNITGNALGWAGVVMRETNDPGAKKAQLMTNLSNFSRREFRTMTNGAAHPQQFPTFNRYWLRIVRSGNQFIMYVSHNGSTWSFAGAQNISMNSCIEIGLVTTNYSSSSTVTATFANVSFEGSEFDIDADSPQQVLDKSRASDLDWQDTDFKVYPNPTSGELIVDLRGYTGREVRIELYGMEGRLMQFSEIDGLQTLEKKMNLTTFPPGMYLMKVKSEGLLDATKRIVVTR